MKVEFVRWSCECEGIRCPDHTEDVILWDCRGDEGCHFCTFSPHYKDKSYEPLSVEQVIKHIRYLGGLSIDGDRFRQIKQLLGV